MLIHNSIQRNCMSSGMQCGTLRHKRTTLVPQRTLHCLQRRAGVRRSTLVTVSAAADASALGLGLSKLQGFQEAIATVRQESSWLRQYNPFSAFSDSAVEDLLLAVTVSKFQKGDTLVSARSTPDRLLIIREGQVECVPSDGNPSISCQAGSGAVFNFQELLLDRKPTSCVKALTDVVAWSVPREAFERIALRNSDVMLQLTQLMSTQLQAAKEAAQEEKQRQRVLLPFRVASPKRGIVGQSKYAERLRKQIVLAARDPTRSTVVVFGEPGLEKDNIAALVHYGSKERAEPMIRVDCERADWVSELLGQGLRRGLLYWLGEGTLLLNNVHQATPMQLEAVTQLLEAVKVFPLPLTGSKVVLRGRPRIIMTSERRVPSVEAGATVIQVPPLRLRPGDIVDYQRYFLQLIVGRTGLQRPELTAEARRQLQSYSFPGNLQELEALVERAVVQAEGPSDKEGKGKQVPKQALTLQAGVTPELSEDVFWFAKEGKDRFRWNLLAAYPAFRQFLRSPVWPELLNMRVVAPAFAAVVAVLFLGPQDREHNFALNAFWAYWWPLIFVAYPFLGRIWCSFCPFMIYGEIVQRWRLSQGAELLKWPRTAMEKYGAWFLWALFAGILVWEEVWDLQNTAALSSWLLLLITGGAVACSLVFEKRLWCRYLCPIGGMNGMFAKLAMTELRARQGVCSGNCTTYSCYKGGPEEPPEQLATQGCPLGSHPAQLTDNRNCVLCMDCLKACNHRSVQFRLRPPGIDLWTSHKASYSELSLMFLLLGAVYLHHLPQLYAQLHLDPATLTDRPTHILASLAVLLIPGAVAFATQAAANAMAKAPSSPTQAANFESLAYGYLPLVWGATLAHYEYLFLTEAGHILPVTALTFGLDFLEPLMPSVEAHPAVISFLQGTTLLASGGLSVLLTARIASAAPWRAILPQVAGITAFGLELWALIVWNIGSAT